MGHHPRGRSADGSNASSLPPKGTTAAGSQTPVMPATGLSQALATHGPVEAGLAEVEDSAV